MDDNYIKYLKPSVSRKILTLISLVYLYLLACNDTEMADTKKIGWEKKEKEQSVVSTTTEQETTEDDADKPVMISGSWLTCGLTDQMVGCSCRQVDGKKCEGSLNWHEIRVADESGSKEVVENFSVAPLDSPWNITFVPTIVAGHKYLVTAKIEIEDKEYEGVSSFDAPLAKESTDNSDSDAPTYLDEKPHAYYRFVIDSVGVNCGCPACSSTNGHGTVFELEFSWNRTWQHNNMTSSNTGTIGDLKANISQRSYYDDTGTDHSWDSADYRGWRAFDGGTNGLKKYATGQYGALDGFKCDDSKSDAVNPEKEYIQIELESSIKLDAYRVTGGGPSGPDRYWLLYSDDGNIWKKLPGSQGDVYAADFVTIQLHQ